MKNTILLFICCVFAFIARAQENWPQFRGPNGQGISQATNLPVQWSANENIAWKTEIPGEGWSSPIVWNNHIFLTATTEEGKNCHVIAVDSRTGQIIWNKIVFTQQANQQRHDMNSYSTPTPVTDGNTVFAVFNNGSFAALDFDGNIRWINSDLDFYSQHGMGTSPILHGDLIILAVNHSNREEPRRLGWQLPWDRSFLLALDKNSGAERWRTLRGMTRAGHATPAVLNVNGKDQIISPVGDAIQGFDPADGRLIWTVISDGEPCVPSPVFGGGLVYTVPTGNAPIRAIRPDGQGDCTATHIAWEERHNASQMASFLYVNSFLYVCMNNGDISCLDATTGESVWRLQLRSGQLNPSPVYADGKIYVLSEAGTTTVLQLSDDPRKPAEILSRNELNEQCRASIAVAGNRLILRTVNYIWGIGK